MPQHSNWQEMESTVHRPGRWYLLAMGAAFLAMGVFGFLTVGREVPPGIPLLIVRAFMTVFILAGAALSITASVYIILPAHIRHATPDVIPNVPNEPVPLEGSIAHGHLTHEIVENSEAWVFRVAPKNMRDIERFIIGFGVPFSTIFAGVLSWVWHDEPQFGGWPAAIVCATVVTVVCGGSVLLLAGMLTRAAFRQLSQLRIPRNGDDIELELSEPPDTKKGDLATGLRWMFLGDTKRHRVSIPRERLMAVQLCPWKQVTQHDAHWGVQGLLVLERPTEAGYDRLPISFNSDYTRAARQLQQLAEVLNVPFLFCADAEGWRAETKRAKTRPPMHSGGSM